ncbi:hypothetical protein [Coralloluteibacterium stylophorae]|uniref:Uncharacterized protein n=1 Tax=Coralloluteibacterium stylophorae TaxID=1776034 RepID=A0A8J7VSV3_9GAMM|nr:hypothetical protein [Coralloluteibacterium stylophorae]MBS7457699.1 hypothetical protein [Coralloluteibacterium stylophorae]
MSTDLPVTNAGLAARVSALVDSFQRYLTESIALLTNPSGTVTMTDAVGVVHTLPSYPGLVSNIQAYLDPLDGAVEATSLSAAQALASANAASERAQQASSSAQEASTAADEAAASTVDAEVAQAAASAAKEEARRFRDTAGVHKDAAASSASDSESSAALAGQYADNAGFSAAAAGTYSESAEADAEEARQWANAPQNTEVTPGEYSAKHWALFAQDTATGAMIYRGSWNASSGTYPASNKVGDLFKVSAPGTVGGVSYSTGDQIIRNDVGGWDKIDNTEAVTSVAGRVGDVKLVASDISSGTFDAPRIPSLPVSKVSGLQAALDAKLSKTGQQAVTGTTTFEGDTAAPNLYVKRTGSQSKNAHIGYTTSAGGGTVYAGIGNITDTAFCIGSSENLTASATSFYTDTQSGDAGVAGNLVLRSLATISAANLTSSRAFALPNKPGTFAMTSDLSSLAAADHAHSIGDVSGLQEALNETVKRNGAETISGTKNFTHQLIAGAGITSSGDFNFAAGRLRAGSSAVVLSGNPGNVYLRPAGDTSTFGQVVVTAEGAFTHGGDTVLTSPQASKVFVQSSSPSSPSTGDLWIW